MRTNYPTELVEIYQRLADGGYYPGWESGTSFRARCPAHPSRRNTSLHVTDRGNWVQITCHSNHCSRQDVLDALGLRLSAPPEVTIEVEVERPTNFEELADRCFECLRPHGRERFARHIGVTPEAAERLRIGHVPRELVDSHWNRRFTFPIRNAAGKCVGILGRSWQGEKRFFPGSKHGLHLPHGFQPERPIVVCEGAGDVLAALSLGFNAIGRTAAKAGTSDLVQLVNRFSPPHVAVMTDNDLPGESGAVELAEALSPYCGSIRIVQPPENLKDLREWYCAHATRDDVRRKIAATPIYQKEAKLFT